MTSESRTPRPIWSSRSAEDAVPECSSSTGSTPRRPTATGRQFLDEASSLARAHGTVSILPQGRFPWSSAPTDAETDAERIRAEVERHRAALDLLAGRDDVADGRIGLVGHDFGAMHGVVLAADDPRIAAAVMIAATPRWGDWFLPFWPIAGDRWEYLRALAPLDPISRIGDLAPRPVCLQFARNDFFIAAMTGLELHGSAGEPKEMHAYDGDHGVRDPAGGPRPRRLPRPPSRPGGCLTGSCITGLEGRPHAILVTDGLIEALDGDGPSDVPTIDGAGLSAAPGFIELQVNGVGDADFTADPASIHRGAAMLPRHGVTSFLPTIVTSPRGHGRGRSRGASGRGGPDAAVPLGLHVEGPFISPHRLGAHDPAARRDPDLDEIREWMGGGVRMLTLAPELPGSFEAIEIIAAAGAVAAIGHTDADAATAARAIDAGARYATHLFNAMPPLDHREPGPVGAILADERVIVGLIADGIHVHPLVLGTVARVAAGRVSLVSDAVATGLGGRALSHGPDGARLPDGTLAGGSAGLDLGVRSFASIAGRERGPGGSDRDPRPPARPRRRPRDVARRRACRHRAADRRSRRRRHDRRRARGVQIARGKLLRVRLRREHDPPPIADRDASAHRSQAPLDRVGVGAPEVATAAGRVEAPIPFRLRRPLSLEHRRGSARASRAAG